MWHDMPFNQLWKAGRLHVPPAKSLPGSDEQLGHYVVGDGGFPLEPGLMIPYKSFSGLDGSCSKYNQNLSRGRCVVETTFGLLAGRFRILKRAMEYDLVNVPKAMKAICTLHNFVQRTKDVMSQEVESIPLYVYPESSRFRGLAAFDDNR